MLRLVLVVLSDAHEGQPEHGQTLNHQIHQLQPPGRKVHLPLNATREVEVAKRNVKRPLQDDEYRVDQIADGEGENLDRHNLGALEHLLVQGVEWLYVGVRSEAED